MLEIRAENQLFGTPHRGKRRQFWVRRHVTRDTQSHPQISKLSIMKPFPVTPVFKSLLAAACLVGVLETSAQVGGPTPFLQPPFTKVMDFPLERHDVFIRVGMDSLDATYYIPSSPAPPKGFPALLMTHGFADSKNADTLIARMWAANGCITLCYSVRGQGNSSGGTTIVGPAERSDLATVFGYLRNLPGVDTNRIGIRGGSQGGAHALWAIADGLPVKCAVADVITPHWASHMFSNGTIRATFLQLIDSHFVDTTNVYGYAVRYDSAATQYSLLWDLLRRDAFDSLRTLFATGRDIDTAPLHASAVPLAMFLKWQDHYFGTDDGIASLIAQPGPKKLYMGTGGHYSDAFQSEFDFQGDVVAAWIAYFLKIDTSASTASIVNPPTIFYANSALPLNPPENWFTWAHQSADQWPIAGTHGLRLYLQGDSTLSLSPSSRTSDSLVLWNDWDSTYTFDLAYIEDNFAEDRFRESLPTQRLEFTSAPLRMASLWAGESRMKLFVQSSYDRFPVHAHIFEVDGAGQEHFINRINCIVRNWTPGTSGWVEAVGESHAHRFAAGNRIRIVLTNIDTSYSTIWNSEGNRLFSIPLLYQSGAEIFVDATHPSYVELPIVGENPLPITLASFSAISSSKSGTVAIRWRTLSETNNAGFTIERRADKLPRFETIRFIPPAGGSTSIVPQEYVVIDSSARGGVYWYRLRQVDLDGTVHISDAVRVDVLTGVAGTVAWRFGLDANYPNPFNPATTISFELARPGPVTLALYDVLGRETEVLLNQPLDAGRHTISWNATSFASGVYYCRLSQGTQQAVRKILLVR